MKNGKKATLTPRLPRPTADTANATPSRVALRILALLSAPLIIGYPVLVYFSMQHYSARTAAVVLLFGVSPLLVRALRSSASSRAQAADPADVRAAGTWGWVLPAGAVALILGALLADSVRSLLLVPVCVNGALLLSFGLTLFQKRSLVERFARLQHEDLTPHEQRWCRLWTMIWSAFFAFNIALATAFTATRSLEWWTLYNGLLSYLIMGMLFATEYVVRKWRFRRFGSHGLDRALKWCFERMGLVL